MVGYMEIELRRKEWAGNTHFKVICMGINSMVKPESTEMIFWNVCFSN